MKQTPQIKTPFKNLTNRSYFKGWPFPCPYNEDLNWACGIGIKYLTSLAPNLKKSGKTGYVVLDIDDTILMGDPTGDIGVKDMELGEHDGNMIFILPVNNQVVSIAEKARQLGYKIIALTARPLESKQASIVNLNMFKVPYDKIIMNDKEEDPFFKVRVRRSLEKPDATVVLTVGDQPFDCFLPGPSAAIKLPDPDSKNAYIYIPGQ